MEEQAKKTSGLILLPCGCLCIFVFLALIILLDLSKGRSDNIQVGSERFQQIFGSLDLQVEKVESDGRYKYEGGGLTFYISFSEETLNAHPVLKESPNLTAEKQLEVYVLTTSDISYAEVADSLFNQKVSQLLEEESRLYFQDRGRSQSSRSLILQWNNEERLKKGIAFYERALTLLDIPKNQADSVRVKAGKEAELRQLIQEMDAAGLLTQTPEEGS